MAISDSDRLFLRAALDLAARGIYSAPPNPKVGCLFVRNGKVLGRGWHERTGGPHAEIVALTDAGGPTAVAGATCYVSLEPCSHQGRTPPCVNALIDAGVERVVAAATDPNPAVAGGGFDTLSRAGIGVDVLELPEARDLNRGYLSQMERGRPWIRVKVASSLDGRTAMASGESKWITSPAARDDVQHWRARSSAIVTGVGTVLADDPALTVRFGRAPRQPLRVVLDSALRIPASARVFQPPEEALIVTSERAAVAGTTVETAVLGRDRVDLDGLVALLATRECNEILVEAGPELTGAFLASGLWDELLLYQAPKLLGTTARALADVTIARLDDAVQGHVIETRTLGPDLRTRVLRSEEDALHYVPPRAGLPEELREDTHE